MTNRKNITLLHNPNEHIIHVVLLSSVTHALNRRIKFPYNNNYSWQCTKQMCLSLCPEDFSTSSALCVLSISMYSGYNEYWTRHMCLSKCISEDAVDMTFSPSIQSIQSIHTNKTKHIRSEIKFCNKMGHWGKVLKGRFKKHENPRLQLKSISD